ncbi:MAG: fibronectin type III domain-containing protein, partial [Bacteroidaceae bacterium]|nr:fibronectin type III domain-containing protein [Bacteroidaceae bacterium]
MVYYTTGTTTDSVHVIGTTYTLENLQAAHAYTISAVTLCGDGTRTPATYAPSFFTPCTAMTTSDLPITVDFDAYTSSTPLANIDNCWIMHKSGARTYNNYPQLNTTAGPNGGNFVAYFYSYNDENSIYVSPYLEDLNGLYTLFYLRQVSTGVGITVGTMSDPNNAATFSPLQNFVPTVSGQWMECEAVFTNVADSVHYIAYKMSGVSSTGGVYVDEITIDVAPACTRPNGIRVSGVTATSATLHIDDPTEVGNFHVIVMRNADTVINETVTDTVVDLSTLDTLVGSTTYKVIVSSLCSDETETRTLTLTFNTAMESTTLPYSTGFEDDDDQQWAMFNSTTNAWFIGSATSHDGSKALYISNDNGTSNAYSVGSPSFSYAVRAFDFNNAGDYLYSFDWKANGESNYDYIRVWITPGSASYTPGQLPNGGTSPNSYTTASPAGWIDLANGKLNLYSTWHNQTGSFSITEPGVYNLVFMWANDGSGGSTPPGAIDNVEILPLSCPSPSNLVIDSVDENTIAFHWTENGEASSWRVTVGDHTETVSTTSYEASNLSASTSYTISVRSLCSADDSSMALSGTARTSCGAITTLPWLEDFEGYDGLYGSYANRMVGDYPPCYDFIAQSNSGFMHFTSSNYLYQGHSIAFYP